MMGAISTTQPLLPCLPPLCLFCFGFIFSVNSESFVSTILQQIKVYKMNLSLLATLTQNEEAEEEEDMVIDAGTPPTVPLNDVIPWMKARGVADSGEISVKSQIGRQNFFCKGRMPSAVH